MKYVKHIITGNEPEVTKLAGAILDKMLDGDTTIVNAEQSGGTLIITEHSSGDMSRWNALLRNFEVKHSWEVHGDVYNSVEELQQAVYEAAMSMPCDGTIAGREGIAKLINISVAEVINPAERARRERELFVEGEMMTIRSKPIIYDWDNGGDLNEPLRFLYLPLDDGQIVDLLRRVDNLYGDTNQELEDWAAEYQVISRMLIHKKAWVMNPRFLVIDHEFDYILGQDMADLWHHYRDEIFVQKDGAEHV